MLNGEMKRCFEDHSSGGLVGRMSRKGSQVDKLAGCGRWQHTVQHSGKDSELELESPRLFLILSELQFHCNLSEESLCGMLHKMVATIK